MNRVLYRGYRLYNPQLPEEHPERYGPVEFEYRSVRDYTAEENKGEAERKLRQLARHYPFQWWMLDRVTQYRAGYGQEWRDMAVERNVYPYKYTPPPEDGLPPKEGE